MVKNFVPVYSSVAYRLNQIGIESLPANRLDHLLERMGVNSSIKRQVDQVLSNLVHQREQDGHMPANTPHLLESYFEYWINAKELNKGNLLSLNLLLSGLAAPAMRPQIDRAEEPEVREHKGIFSSLLGNSGATWGGRDDDSGSGSSDDD